MDPQTLDILQTVGIAVLAFLAWDRGCRCGKCPFHVNERRMASLEADRKRIEEVEKQNARRHDAQHKGYDWALDGPDKYNCHEEGCARNRPGRGTYL